MAVVSLGISALTVLASAIVAVSVGMGGRGAPVYDVPIVASSALAWGGGFLLAFSASARALRRDRTDGIRALLLARTTSLRGYLLARVGGLALLVALVVGGGTLLCGLVSAAAAVRISLVAKTLHTTFASVVFSVVFAAVVAPVAFAALGARSRVGGYFFLLGVVVAPEVVAAALATTLPRALTEVLSIPSALGVVRSALGPGAVDGVRILRALLALACFVVLSLAVVRRDAIVVERGEVEP